MQVVAIAKGRGLFKVWFGTGWDSTE